MGVSLDPVQYKRGTTEHLREMSWQRSTVRCHSGFSSRHPAEKAAWFPKLDFFGVP